jgi:hypothetical protein
MIRQILLSLLLSVSLAGTPSFGTVSAALADGCLSAGQARAAAQSGQILPLSRILSSIRSAGRGEILPPPQLCDSDGQYVYVVNVLSRDGQVTRITVDAASGAIIGGGSNSRGNDGNEDSGY